MQEIVDGVPIQARRLSDLGPVYARFLEVGACAMDALGDRHASLFA